MNASNIIFPTDFSHCSDAAMGMAESLARDYGAKLVIVHVQEPPVAYGGGGMYYGVPEPAAEDVKRMLSEVKPKDPDVAYEHRLLTGSPAEAIVDLAEELGSEMIVIGTHGRTGLFRLLMGSVAETVVRTAPCPVLSYREPKMEKAKKEEEAGA